MTAGSGWPARLERFATVSSTNDVVAAWLAHGAPEVCVAAADEQTAGRGRNGRTWTAPPGAALLCSLGFRPGYLDARHAWQLAGIVSLAMADAAESVAGVGAGTVRLKWPNDLVVAVADGVRKLGGVLGETEGLATNDPRAVIGIGVNAGWARADFPADLADAMTSVAELLRDGGKPSAAADATALRDALLDTFLAGLEPRVADIREGRFPADEWRERQLTSGSIVRLERPDGSAETVRALDVDPGSGALVVGALSGEWPPRAVHAGEIRHLRLAPEV